MFIGGCDCDEVKREASRFLTTLDIKHRVKKLDIKSVNIIFNFFNKP